MLQSHDLDRNILCGIIYHLAILDESLLSRLYTLNLACDNDLSQARLIVMEFYNRNHKPNNLRSYFEHAVLPGQYLIDMSALGQQIKETFMRENNFDWNRYTPSAKRLVWGTDVKNEHHDGEVYLTEDAC